VIVHARGAGLNRVGIWPIPSQVNVRFRPLTPDLRAYHVAALTVLCRRIARVATPLRAWRGFVVVSVAAPIDRR
jgi:hypothetical protein